MESKLKKDIEFSGKNYKNELVKIFVFSFVCVVISGLIYYFMGPNIYVLFPLGICIIVDILLLTSYSKFKKITEKNREKEFIQIISYFQLFINNHMNVYQCFKLLIPYSSQWMGDQISQMLSEIDNDKSVQPYINFANKFKTSLVENVMLSIYQMVDSGESSEHLNQFEIFFSQLAKAEERNDIDTMERSLSIVDSLPLVGAGAITILITFSVLLLMGDLINVI